MKKIINKLLYSMGFKEGSEFFVPTAKSLERTADLEQEVKFWFRVYFEGDLDLHLLPTESININNFGITKIEFNYDSQAIEMVLHIQRPALLIGKQGGTIVGLKDFISQKIEMPVKFGIIEKNIWK